MVYSNILVSSDIISDQKKNMILIDLLMITLYNLGLWNVENGLTLTQFGFVIICFWKETLSGPNNGVLQVPPEYKGSIYSLYNWW